MTDCLPIAFGVVVVAFIVVPLAWSVAFMYIDMYIDTSTDTTPRLDAETREILNRWQD